MCLRRLNSPRLSVLIPSKTSAVPPKVDPNSPKQVKTNSSRLTEELHERFSITTIDGTSAMFIFHALVLSLTRPNFFSRAIIEPRVQTPLPAPLVLLIEPFSLVIKRHYMYTTTLHVHTPGVYGVKSVSNPAN